MLKTGKKVEGSGSLGVFAGAIEKASEIRISPDDLEGAEDITFPFGQTFKR